jgi:DNA-binding MarR family transcriptional regulator
MSLSVDRHIGWLLSDTARLWRKRYEQKARAQALGLTRAQAAVIAHLARREGINQAALAQILEIEPMTLVRLLDRLEGLGFVERRPDPNDRRARNLHLTEAASSMLEHIREVGAMVLEEACAGITPERRDLLCDILLEMKTNLAAETNSEVEAAEWNGRSIVNG